MGIINRGNFFKASFRSDKRIYKEKKEEEKEELI